MKMRRRSQSGEAASCQDSSLEVSVYTSHALHSIFVHIRSSESHLTWLEEQKQEFDEDSGMMVLGSFDGMVRVVSESSGFHCEDEGVREGRVRSRE